MGGIIICVAFMSAVLLWIPLEVITTRRFELVAIALIFFAGIRDDIEPLRPIHKLLVQIIAAAMVVIAEDIRVPSLYGLFGIYEIPIWLSYVGTILFIIFITNAFNLIDGIDGLAGSIAVIALGFLCFWFYNVGTNTGHMEIIWLACIVGAIAGFLYYNWQPASIFMGDTGSLVIGFILSISTIVFISTNGALPADNCYKFPAVLSAGVAIVILPAFDTIRVFLLRIRQGKSPFLPDKQHLHHIIWRVRQTHAKATRLIVACYILFTGLILLGGRYLPDWLLLAIILIVCIGVDLLLGYTIKHALRKERKHAPGH